VPGVRARAAALAALGLLSGPGAGAGAPDAGLAALDVVVVGGGQSALAVGYYLRRSGLSYALLDAEAGPGGAWRHAWPSLRLFSPAQWSSLPGWLMPRGADEYPTRDETLAYLAAYERRYALPVVRPVRVTAVRREGGRLTVDADTGRWRARAVVSATGSWRAPVIPDVPGAEAFGGETLHSACYPGPAPFAGRRVIVVGAGNSGAQIAAELAEVADLTWATREPPHYLPAHVDGRYLFEQATARWQALREGRPGPPPHGLGDVVLVAPVRRALERGLLRPVPMFARFTAAGVAWEDEREQPADAVIWATGFRPALAHLDPLGVRDERGRVAVRGTRAVHEPRLWLVGYGDWTGFASATLIGVGRTARETVREVEEALR
jgi:cation diffusion facilitator CzcD-associated flavoprotein CzcO